MAIDKHGEYMDLTLEEMQSGMGLWRIWNEPGLRIVFVPIQTLTKSMAFWIIFGFWSGFIKRI